VARFMGLREAQRWDCYQLPALACLGSKAVEIGMGEARIDVQTFWFFLRQGPVGLGGFMSQMDLCLRWHHAVVWSSIGRCKKCTLWWHRLDGLFGEEGELRSASCFQMVQSSPIQRKVYGDKSHRLLAESSFSASHCGVFNLEVIAWSIL